MITIVIGVGAGIAYLASRLYERKKNKKILDDVLLKQDFEVYEFSKWVTYSLYVMTVLSIICAYVGYLENNELNLALGILLAFLSLAEAINSLDLTKLYYCEHGCIINNEYIRYRSMKSLRRKYALPLSKWNLQTFNKAKITINKPVALFIEKNGNIPVVYKQD